MLWQKESNDESAYYIDIFQQQRKIIYGYHRLVNSPDNIFFNPTSKDNKRSTNIRKFVGNEAFGKQQFVRAVHEYNRSLCFAEIGTENVSLAYANRSACFFKMKMYDKCLVDIKLAKEANYPDRLMSKLIQREADCLKFIAEGQQAVPFEPKLSFSPDKKFPCMANVLQIKHNDEFGHHIIATSDISVGQTILIEEAFISAQHQDKYSRCGACSKVFGNLVACPICPIAMFCHGKCENNDFHKIECDIKPHQPCDDNQQLSIIRTVLLAINIFPTVEELHEFVKDAVASDPMQIPESLSDKKSKYCAFLKLKYSTQLLEMPKFVIETDSIYKLLLENATIGPKFSTKGHKRFLMHLIAHHSCVYFCNSRLFEFYAPKSDWNYSELLSIVSSYIQHSCAPNVTAVCFNGFKVLVALRPIKKDAQIFAYFQTNELIISTAHLKNHWLAKIDFERKCCRFKRIVLPQSDRDVMKNDAFFKYIQMNKHIMAKLDTGSEPMKKLLIACTTFLAKYGDKGWSDEIELASQCYKRFLAAKHGMVHLYF